MTRRTLLAVALVGAPIAAAGGDPPPPPKSRAAQLVAQLGSDDFFEREAAGKELDALGPVALDDLRAACRSADPEVARRARDLAAGISFRAESERLLAPTLVELDAADAPLDTVLAELSRQSKYEVVAGGGRPAELAAKKVTVKTGRVPFWAAVLQVCDAADAQIGSVAGFAAPGSTPVAGRVLSPAEERARVLALDRPVLIQGGGPPGFVPPAMPAQPPLGAFVPPQGFGAPPGVGAPRPAPAPPGGGRAGVRTVTQPGLAVVLEPRGAAKKRPATVFGAVCVEAVPLPPDVGVAGVAAALLQVWPEPKLAWKENRGVKLARAADADDRPLVAIHDPPPMQQAFRGGGARAFRAANGNVIMINDGAEVPQPPLPRFTPNARQSLVKFKAGDRPPAAVKEFAGAVFALVRSGTEVIATAELEAGKQVVAGGPGNATVRAMLVEGDEPRLDVDVTYDPNALQIAGQTDRLADGPNLPGGVNHTFHGLRVTDGDGNPFFLSQTGAFQARPDGAGRQVSYGFRFALRPAGKSGGPPKTVSLWGTFGKSVEVPFDLKDAPVVVGKK